MKHNDLLHSYNENSPLLYPSTTINGDNHSHVEDLTRDRNNKATENSCPKTKLEVPTAESCLKNMILIPVIFVMVFTGYCSLANLESSLSLIGEESLSVASVAAVIGCYVSPLVLKSVRPKIILACAWFCMSLFIAANFYPVQYTLFPACVLYGFTSGSAWTAQLSYTTNTAIMYAKLKGKSESNWIAISNGIFFLAYSCSQVFGNVISSQLIQREKIDIWSISEFPSRNVSETDNYTIPLVDTDPTFNITCGAAFCPAYTTTSGRSADAPPQASVNVLLGIFLGCVGSGFMVTVLFLDPLAQFTLYVKPNPLDEASDTPQTILLSPLVHLKDIRMILLVPVLMYTGMQQIMIVAQYTNAFVTCTVGIHYVGYVMMVWGICNAVFSLLSGLMVSCIGRPILTLTGFFIQLALQIYLLEKVTIDVTMLFVVAACWGAADGLFHSQISALIGLTFRQNQEAAFAAIRMLYYLGLAITFGFSATLCQRTDLFIALPILSVVIVSYISVEILIYKNRDIKGKVSESGSLERSLTNSVRIL